MFPKTSFLNDFFDTDLPVDWNNSNGFNSDWIPAANIKEAEKEFKVELSVPGYTKKDIHVEVDSNNALRIIGELNEEETEEKNNYTRREFSYGAFARSFQLPETVDEGKVSATCKEGVLTVELPKKETAILKTKTKEIEVT